MNVANKARRALTLALVAGGIVMGVPWAIRRFQPFPPTEPIPGVPGFYRMNTGGISYGNPALVGVEATATPNTEAWQGDPRPGLFAPHSVDQVPLAVFTDVNCPNCRVLSGAVVDWQTSRRSDIAVRWHELPLLGPPSVLAARAALAAEQQGGYLDMHHKLMQNRFRPSPTYLRQLAQDSGLDPDRLQADMDGLEVAKRLRDSAALAALFRIPGTPATVIGNTLVIGALSKLELDRLIARAKRTG